MKQVMENLGASSFMAGDSSQGERKSTFKAFINSLDDLIKLKRTFTLILDDPMGNSYVQNLFAPDPDPSLQVQEYERTKEQNEELGLDAIHTDDQPISGSEGGSSEGGHS